MTNMSHETFREIIVTLVAIGVFVLIAIWHALECLCSLMLTLNVNPDSEDNTKNQNGFDLPRRIPLVGSRLNRAVNDFVSHKNGCGDQSNPG